MKGPDMYAEPSVIILSDEDNGFIREHKKLIDQQHMILAALQSALVNRVRARYGIDIDRENWEIDLDRGILRAGSRIASGIEEDATI